MFCPFYHNKGSQNCLFLTINQSFSHSICGKIYSIRIDIKMVTQQDYSLYIFFIVIRKCLYSIFINEFSYLQKIGLIYVAAGMSKDNNILDSV